MATTAYPAEQFRPLNSSTQWEWAERDRLGSTYRGLTVNQPATFVVRLETPPAATNALMRVFGYRASENSFRPSLVSSLASGIQTPGPIYFGFTAGWTTTAVSGFTATRGASYLMWHVSPGDLLVGGWATWNPGPGEFVSKVERIYDSRAASTDWGQSVGKFHPNEERWLQVPVPVTTVGAHAAVLNVTVTQTEGSGWLAVYPPGGYPGTSTINWSGPNQTLANNTQTAIGPVQSNRYGVLLRTGPSRAHVVVDLLGYYRAVTS